ncbi:cell division protein FtsK [Aminobacter sp. DSM 101952]|uniref:DNA translocase FtsK n=1 Tax=Aminobacter sp. DSM 101952 TaxID=2735891 RepID=UPI0006F54ED9|nr:DNA translocase FtsK [Aminobacter sp. DSM 101952]KQU65840.1 cell division protein FtsK [Aminobacter sp. DSM 101952]
MASTRYPRINPSNPASPDSSEQPGGSGHSGRVVNLYGDEQTYMKPGGNLPAGSPKPGGVESPTWQDYFFLAPNVRFTRTPDYEAAKRSPRDTEADVAGIETAAPVDSQASSTGQRPVAPVNNRDTAQPTTGSRAHPSPAGPLQRVVEKAQVLRSAAPATATATTAMAQRPTPRQTDAATAGTSGQETRWSYLSDHAFFEFMAPYVVESTRLAVPSAPVQARVAPAVTAPIAPAPVAARHVDERPAPAIDVTSLFRVIERPSKAQSAATSASAALTPVEPKTAIAEAAPARALQESAIAPLVAANDAVPAPAAKSVEITMPVPVARPASPLPPMAALIHSHAGETYELPSEELLQLPPEGQGFYMSQERLEQNADLLESVLEDFGVRGEIIHVRPGPVVTLYEFEPAPGVKSSRVIGLADDIARSMSAISARVAVIPGRNVIGIELPNETRETVYFRELIESGDFRNTSCKLALCLGKTIGGEPVIAELAKMPHLLVAGTTGSGKSVAINTMILSLLYRLKPEECRLIMVDPKMLELSVYDGIPHLLTPVVTDPKKAVTALKWAVREMEDRYRKMARLGVRNIDGYNQRAAVARDKGETVVMQVQTGFEKGTGAPLFDEQEIDLAPMPYIVVIVDEMADLMMVAGKEIEGAIQRLAQMARAAGIHLIMATQRPSVDVITGTIKANFPTRISFQVTSKIDSRTILGEQGAEQLLGQGDMLHMAGGGRIARVHGPFVSDAEVEQVVAHLKSQGRPEYLETVTADEEDEAPEADESPVFDKSSMGAEDGDNIYDEAVKVVLRDKKCSTSYIQRRLGIGYNRAASLVERMEKEGIVGAPNHVGKREIMLGRREPGNGPDDME